MDALIDSGALVNCLPANEFEKTKSISPDNILKVMNPPTFERVKLYFEIGDMGSTLFFRERSRG